MSFTAFKCVASFENDFASATFNRMEIKKLFFDKENKPKINKVLYYRKYRNKKLYSKHSKSEIFVKFIYFNTRYLYKLIYIYFLPYFIVPLSYATAYS